MWNLAYRLAQLRGASKLPGYRMAIAGVWCPQHRSLYSQEMLAEMIGTTRSRVSFFMNKFRKLGFIEYNGKLEVHKSLLNMVLQEKPEIRTKG